MVNFGKKLTADQVPEWRGYYINYKLMKKKVKQYGQQIQQGEKDRHRVLKDFSKMLDDQIEKIVLFLLEQQGMLASRIEKLGKQRAILAEQPDISGIAELREAYREVGLDLIKLLKFVDLNATGIRKILKKFDKRFSYRFTDYYVSSRSNHPYSQLQQVFKHVGVGVVVGALSRNLVDLQEHQGSYLSIYDQPPTALKDPIIDMINSSVDKLTRSTNFLRFLGQHALIAQEESPSTAGEEEIEDQKYHFISLMLNLVNTFLYMVNTYIIVPTADDYSVSLGAASTVCGVVIGSMAVAQIFSSVYFSAWSNAPAYAAVPDKYVFPPEKRPSVLLDDATSDVALPVIDLHGAALSDHHHQVAAEIIRAGKEFGFFQVVNHGVAEGVVRGFREAAAELFALPAEEKMPYCSEDQSRPFRLASSTSYDRSQTRYWRDYLKLTCHPVSEELVRHWPAKPATFRSSLAEYAAAVHDLAQTLLSLVAEGLGLPGGFFAGDLSGGDTQMNVNYYPPCPDPSVTLGLLPHCDRHLLTVLSQGDVAGLQAKHCGRWLLVRPVPGAFVINFGHQMEIVTNGVLASVEHRAVTNSAAARMSVATLVMPTMDCRIGPAPEMVSEASPARFRSFVFSEFMEAYGAAAASREDALESFRIDRSPSATA